MTTATADEWGFTVRELDDQDTQNFLRGILRQENCIPFIGAGFTGGERARNGAVPRGAEWMDIMRKQIAESTAVEKPSHEDLLSYSFQELSDIYFRDDLVPLDVVKESINSHFTNVRIDSESKRAFLNIDWPYVYTLNIDDGIENAIDAVKVLPYKPFGTHVNRRFVYKLHGDAEDVLSAAGKKDLQVIFGRADYIRSLKRNEHLLADLTNDFVEKNIIFVGCSLNDELDISFALANIDPSIRIKSNARVFVTGKAPTSYTEKKRLRDYGITDVVVGDYSMFYDFSAKIAASAPRAGGVLEVFTYVTETAKFSPQRFITYLLQAGWKQGENAVPVSVAREFEQKIIEKIDEPLVVFWGRRSSGKTTVLQRLLNGTTRRRRVFIPSHSSVSDRVFNAIFAIEDAVVAIDSGAIHVDQLRILARKVDTLRDHNTTVILAVSRAELNALGNGYADEADRLESYFNTPEVIHINNLLDPLGLQRWRPRDNILDNIFHLGRSPIASKLLQNKTRLDVRVNAICTEGRADGQVRAPTKLEFAALFYLTIRQRMYSRVHRAIAKRYGMGYMADSHIEDFAKKWAPLIELDSSDVAARRAENSALVLICNSYAWTQYALRALADKLGLELTSSYIVDLYSAVRDVDSEPFQLVLFDNLNSIFASKAFSEHDWGSRVITLVYEKLAAVMAQQPDYWLQRAKGIYYLSHDASALRIAVAYCEKGIMDKDQKVWINAKLTRANLLGKICHVTNYSLDEDLNNAIAAYLDAINDRSLNPSYIDELLRKSVHGVGYMTKVCRAAQTRASLLPRRQDIRFILEYARSA